MRETDTSGELVAGRRGFLKTSAAATGVALLGSTLQAATALASEEDQPNLDEVQLLFVQNAHDVTMDGGELKLVNVNPTTIFFSDRPKRIAGHMSTEDFVLDWQEETGKESFHADPPNATLSIFGEGEIVDVVMELKNPRLSEGTLIYDADVLYSDDLQAADRQLPSGPVSLFIDPVGRPMSPTSVAGVHRRQRRRYVRHAVR